MSALIISERLLLIDWT